MHNLTRGHVCSGIPYLSVPENETCSVDRSTLSLHSSSNLVDWVRVGFVDYTVSYTRHFTNPSMIVIGPDLLIASEASIGGEKVNPCAPCLCLPLYSLGLLGGCARDKLGT